MQGGKFWNSFAAESISSLASSAWTGGGEGNGYCDGVGGDFGHSGVGTIAFGTIAGGAGSYLTGGNFWEGAVTGMIVSGFNHVMHSSVIKNRAELFIAYDESGSCGVGGHIALMGGDEEHGYRYASDQGAKEDGNAFFADYNKNAEPMGDEDITFEHRNSAVAWMKFNGYTNIFSVKLPYSEVQNALNGLINYAKGYGLNYNFLLRNCADAVLAGLFNVNNSNIQYGANYANGSIFNFVHIPRVIYNDLWQIYKGSLHL